MGSCYHGNNRISSYLELSARSNLRVMNSHHRDVKPLALLRRGHAGQGDGLLQLLHHRPVVGAAQRGLGAEAPLQRQAEGALAQVAPAVLQRL